MPFVINGSRRGGRALAIALFCTLAAASPAMAGPGDARKLLKQAAANPESCRPDHQLLNPFAGWKDAADYALAPGGDFESGAAGWELEGAAGVVADNQPFDIGQTVAGDSSLGLPEGSAAISAPMCIDATYPHFRVFARNVGDYRSALKVDVLYVDGTGHIVKVKSGDIRARSAEWFPTGELSIDVTFDANVAYGAAPVAFRFSSGGRNADWRVDDVYVDPFARR